MHGLRLPVPSSSCLKGARHGFFLLWLLFGWVPRKSPFDFVPIPENTYWILSCQKRLWIGKQILLCFSDMRNSIWMRNWINCALHTTFLYCSVEYTVVHNRIWHPGNVTCQGANEWGLCHSLFPTQLSAFSLQYGLEICILFFLWNGKTMPKKFSFLLFNDSRMHLEITI